MTTPIPSEFIGFVRETGVKAFDRLARRARDLENPLRSFVLSWSRFSTAQKNALFDELIASAHLPDAPSEPPPAETKQKRQVKRYDPEEVAATLPKKTSPRSKAKKKSQ